MKKDGQKIYLSHNRTGFALILLLVAVLIVMLLYFVDLKAIFGPAKDFAPTDSEGPPWSEEYRILAADEIIRLPKPPKPQINEPFTVTASVAREQSDRGLAAINFTENGEVSGHWSCKYSQQERENAINAEFSGNIDVTKTYSQGKKPDPSLLYFIAKGRYVKKTYNTATSAESAEQGLAYLTGYLAPDYSASGKITITTDKSWSAVYHWQTEP